MCLRFFVVKRCFKTAESSLRKTCLLPPRCVTARPWTLPCLQSGSDFCSLNPVIFLAKENSNFLCFASLLRLPKTLRRLFRRMAGARLGSFFRMTRQIELLRVGAYSPEQLLPTFCTAVAQKNQKRWVHHHLFVQARERRMAWGKIWRVLPLSSFHFPKVGCDQERFCNKSFLQHS